MSKLRIYVQRLRNASINANESTFGNDSIEPFHFTAIGNLFLLENMLLVVFLFFHEKFSSVRRFARYNNITFRNGQQADRARRFIQLNGAIAVAADKGLNNAIYRLKPIGYLYICIRVHVSRFKRTLVNEPEVFMTLWDILS